MDESSGVREEWLGTDQLRLFTERLQPQQWLGPSNIAWVRDLYRMDRMDANDLQTEWDSLMTHMDGIRA